MIFFHKDIKFKKENVRFKKEKQYSSDFTFIPIQYNKEDILIQTPYCFVPFGINQFSKISNKKYLDVSFQENNKEFIKDCFQFFYDIVNDKYSDKYHVEPFLKKSQFSNLMMRFKVNEDCLFFDQNKKRINTFETKIFGIFIIQLSGLWIMNQKMWFNWNILQAKMTLPIKLKEYAFLDDQVKEVKFIPPPPPPPPPPSRPPPSPRPPPPPPPSLNKYNQMLKLGIPKEAVEHKKKVDRIQASDLQKVVLRKTVHEKNKKVNNKDNYTPSIDEIRNALQSLQKIN